MIKIKQNKSINTIPTLKWGKEQEREKERSKKRKEGKNKDRERKRKKIKNEPEGKISKKVGRERSKTLIYRKRKKEMWIYFRICMMLKYDLTVTQTTYYG